MSDASAPAETVPASAADVESLRRSVARRRRRSFLLLSALVVAIVAIRAALVAAYAGSLPFWDEWDAIIGFQLHKAVLGILKIRDLFEAHVDHPIVMTRSLFAFVLWLNHYQFDNLPMALLNAPLYALAWAIPTWRFATHPVARMRWFALLFAIAGLAPTDWEDIVTGFQSAFYFLLGSAMLVLWSAASTQGRSWQSIVRFALLAALACLTFGSGVFAAMVAIAVCALRAVGETGLRRPLLIRSAIGVGITAFGVWLHSLSLGARISHPLGWHRLLDALSCVAWPYAGNAAVGLLASLPFAAFLVRLLRNRRGVSTDWFVFGIGLWVALHALVFAVAREVNGTVLPSRYLLILQFWPLINVYCLMRLVGDAAVSGAGWRARARAAVPAMVAAVLLVLFAGSTYSALGQLRERGELFAEQTQRVAMFVRTRDATALAASGLHLPYPSAQRLQQLLTDPITQKMLPPDARLPLVMGSAPADGGPAFAWNGYAPGRHWIPGLSTFGSYLADGAAATAGFRSVPMQTEYPFVIVQMAGDLGQPDLSLQLACDAPCSAREALPLAPLSAWRAVPLQAPRGKFRLVARDSSNRAWFAFTAPVEAGVVSAAAAVLVGTMRARPWGMVVLTAGVMLLLLAAAWRLRRVPESDDPPPQTLPPAPPAGVASLRQPADAAGARQVDRDALPTRSMVSSRVTPDSSAVAAWYRRHRTACVLAAIAVLTLAAMILRRPDQWSAPYVWVEEGTVMLPDFMINGWRSLLHPAAGYFLLPTKLILAASATLSFRWLPQIEYWMTLLMTGAVLAAIAFSPTQLRFRALCALSLLVLPIDSEVYGVSAYAFWWGSVLVVLPLLWRTDGPQRPLLRAAFLLFGGLSSPLIIVMVPLYALRAFWQRDWPALRDLGVAAIAAAIQSIAVTGSGQAGNTAIHQLAPLPFIAKFFGYFIYVPAQASGRIAVVLGAGLIFAALLLVFTVRHRSELGRAYFLSFAAFLLAALASAARVPLTDIHPAFGGPRYFFLPFAFLSMALVQLASVRSRYVYVSLAVIAALALRNTLDIGVRYHDHLDWTTNVDACAASDRYVMPVHFDGRANTTWQAPLSGADCRRMINRSWFDARIDGKP